MYACLRWKWKTLSLIFLKEFSTSWLSVILYHSRSTTCSSTNERTDARGVGASDGDGLASFCGSCQDLVRPNSNSKHAQRQIGHHTGSTWAIESQIYVYDIMMVHIFRVRQWQMVRLSRLQASSLARRADAVDAGDFEADSCNIVKELSLPRF